MWLFLSSFFSLFRHISLRLQNAPVHHPYDISRLTFVYHRFSRCFSNCVIASNFPAHPDWFYGCSWFAPHPPQTLLFFPATSAYTQRKRRQGKTRIQFSSAARYMKWNLNSCVCLPPERESRAHKKMGFSSLLCWPSHSIVPQCREYTQSKAGISRTVCVASWAMQKVSVKHELNNSSIFMLCFFVCFFSPLLPRVMLLCCNVCFHPRFLLPFLLSNFVFAYVIDLCRLCALWLNIADNTGNCCWAFSHIFGCTYRAQNVVVATTKKNAMVFRSRYYLWGLIMGRESARLTNDSRALQNCPRYAAFFQVFFYIWEWHSFEMLQVFRLLLLIRPMTLSTCQEGAH